MKPRKWGIAIIGIAALMAGLLYSKGSEPQNPAPKLPQSSFNTKENSQIEAPHVGYQAPDFTLEDFEGKKVHLRDLRGKPVFLNFWASWCPPCRQETPDLAKMAKKYKEKVQFYGVNLTVNDQLEIAKEFVKSFGVTYPNMKDTDGKVAMNYQVQAIPTSFIIAADGKIVYASPGAISEKQLDSLLQQVLSGSN